jgi:hypothetical protein
MTENFFGFGEQGFWLMACKTETQSNGGTGFQPVQAQAKACGYKKLLTECKLRPLRKSLINQKSL